MRKRSTVMIVVLAAMVMVTRGQKSPQAPPREFTNSVSMKFVRIAPGTFKMGWEKQGPIHDVTLSKGYYLQTTEVTQAQWEAVMGTSPSHFFKEPGRPVETVSWNDVQEFLRKLNAREKTTRYRLPTEAEWEYACRAGGQEPDEAANLDDVAWWKDNSGDRTHPVGQKKANLWGLYDMRGNVWEWVQDWSGPYSAEPQTDPQGAQSGELRVVRGGSWNNVSTDYFRCAFRSQGVPGLGYDFLHGDSGTFGFRCARTF